MELQFSAKTDVGIKRKLNEDCVFVNENIGLCAVADGMGGHSAGDVASRMVIDIVEEAFSDFEPTDDDAIKEAINETIQLANYAVKTSASQNPDQRGMGSTITLLYFFQDRYYVAQVGDSRAYLIRENQIYQITEDHSLVQQELEKGLITEEEAESHVFKNIITRAVGIKDEVEVDFYSDRTMEGDIFLLCSDGLTNKVSNLDILKEVTSANTLDSIAGSLIELANIRDGSDNISVVLVKVGSKKAVSSPTTNRSALGKYALYTGGAVALLAVVFFVWNQFFSGGHAGSPPPISSPKATTALQKPTPEEMTASNMQPTKFNPVASPTPQVNTQDMSQAATPTAIPPTAVPTNTAIPPTPTTPPPTPTRERYRVREPALQPTSAAETYESEPTVPALPGIPFPDSYKEGLSLLKEGNLEAASESFNRMLAGVHARYTLQVEVNTLPKSVLTTFERHPDLNLFMIIKRKKYYVFSGLFNTRKEALNALRMLPEEMKAVGPMVKPLSRVRR